MNHLIVKFDEDEFPPRGKNPPLLSDKREKQDLTN